MDDKDNVKGKRERSPSFPFISLEKAIERTREFAEEYRRHEARVRNIGAKWGYKPMGSIPLQTIAALKAFGLMEDTGGTREDRKVKLTDLAWRILHDERPGMRENAIKEAALRPRLIADHWEQWKGQRPPDNECVSDLHLEKGFTKDAANRFLTVFDETISYANLIESDTIIAREDDKDQETEEGQNGQIVRPQTIRLAGEGVELMENERVVYTYESQPDNRVRLIASGLMNEELLDALEIYVTLQKKKLQAQKQQEARDTRQQPIPMADKQPQLIQESPHSLE